MELLKTIESFVSGWNTPEADKRAVLWVQSLAPTFYYADPRVSEGLGSAEAFAEYMGAFFEQEGANLHMQLDGAPDIYGRHGRFRIIMRQNDQILGRGSYFVDFAEDGRMLRAIGFVDP